MTDKLYKLTDATKVVVRNTTEEEVSSEVPWLDYSALTEYSYCLVNGLLKNHLQKSAFGEGGGRRMALEAGSAAHEVFAAHRIHSLKTRGLDDHFTYHGLRLFGERRFNGMLEFVDDQQSFALEALYNSGFTDDPDDKRRTTGNIEEACIIYMQSYNSGEFPVWVEDESNAESRVGIEIPVDMTVEFHFEDEVMSNRIVGKVDGIHTNSDGEIVLNENKTASRMDMSWQMAFGLSHQLSVYALAMSTYLGKAVELVDVYGITIPTPRSGNLGGYLRIPEVRTSKHFNDFLVWLLHNSQMRDFYGDDVENAPRSTNSCNRFFSTCEFINYCNAQDFDRADVLEQMSDATWHPHN